MKILLLDADGVCLKKVDYFSVLLSKRQNIEPEIVADFFKKEFILCQKGKADLKVEIAKYLELWKWQGTVDDLLSYWFEYDVALNQEVMDKLSVLKEGGVLCYLASNQERYRAQKIMELFNAHGVLDGYFFSCDLGVRKSGSEFFEKVLAKLAVVGEEVSYIDNDQSNLDSAVKLGIDTYLFSDDVFNRMLV